MHKCKLLYIYILIVCTKSALQINNTNNAKKYYH